MHLKTAVHEQEDQGLLVDDMRIGMNKAMSTKEA